MIQKKPLIPQRVRTIGGSFAYIEHRFLRDGFFASLSHHELLIYFFLVLASDRNGLSFYSYDKICSLLEMDIEDYLEARNNLIKKDLIAFDGRLFQVLSLPDRKEDAPPTLLKTQRDMARHDPATIHHICRQTFGEKPRSLAICLTASSEPGRASQVLLTTITNRRGDFHGLEGTSSNITVPE